MCIRDSGVPAARRKDPVHLYYNLVSMYFDQLYSVDVYKRQE